MCGVSHHFKDPETVKKISGKNAVLYGVTGDDHPCGGTKWWVNSENKKVRTKEKPGPEWIPGRKWNPTLNG